MRNINFCVSRIPIQCPSPIITLEGKFRKVQGSVTVLQYERVLAVCMVKMICGTSEFKLNVTQRLAEI